MDKEYYIYHIPGKKIGCTADLYERVTNQQGYETGEYEILYRTPDMKAASKMERILQKEYGYRVDMKSYEELSNNNLKLKNMKINVTEQTTTFPCPLNKLKGRLMDNLEMRWDTEHGSVYLDADLVKWIVKSAKTSMFNTERCYVYNKAMARYIDNTVNTERAKAMSLPFPSENGCCQEVEPELFSNRSFYYKQPSDFTTFDLIRSWAKERGLYDKGDPKTQYVKLIEEAGEVGRAILKDRQGDIIDGIGDMVVVLTNLAELCDTSIEECVEEAYDVISRRTGKMVNGTFVKDN